MVLNRRKGKTIHYLEVSNNIFSNYLLNIMLVNGLGEDIKINYFRLGGLADKIFTSMDPKTPEAYCSLIQGMAKYYQVNS